MSSRMPSFIVVGLFIIMFLLAVFYTSCSSKNNELRLSLEQFEERVRSLSIKNSDAEKKIESLNTRKREIEEEKLTLQRQIEKKDSEINDLNTKINEKISEIKSLASDKDVLSNQLKDCQTLSETISDKNSLIEKLQREINKEKEFNAAERIRLQQEVDNFKVRSGPTNESLTNNQQNVFQQPQQRFVPLLVMNTTARSIAALLQGGIQNNKDVAREVKPNFIAAAPEPLPQPGGLLQDQIKHNPIESAQAPPNAPEERSLGKSGNVDGLQLAPQRMNIGANNRNPGFGNDGDDEDDEDAENDMPLEKDARLQKRDLQEVPVGGSEHVSPNVSKDDHSQNGKNVDGLSQQNKFSAKQEPHLDNLVSVNNQTTLSVDMKQS